MSIEEAYTVMSLFNHVMNLQDQGKGFKRNCKRNGMTANGSNILMDY